MIGANTTIDTKRIGAEDADGHRDLEGSNTLTGIPAYIEKTEGTQAFVDEDNQMYFYSMDLEQDVDIQEDDEVTDADGNVYTVLDVYKEIGNIEVGPTIVCTLSRPRG